MAIPKHDQVDVSGSFDIEANIERAIQSSKAEEAAKEDSQLGSGKQEALAKLHMKKSPSVVELEFSGNKRTGKKNSERRSPERLDTDEPLETCTEDQSHQ